ncbi:hypothetical protein [Stenotrophomonas forensis]|uniref:Uncharacterized protein n=1 Tax=Stenotrophomonas forensis TaxID=2871169 RepID=A0ABY7Y5P7_9GAMM|nr:hypothetical protein [Stenotrophomonas sp. DFS-20110405]WDM65298.1 hypothetical protein K5L94_08505 [Stenotrophomonas sp. DFS-20110405]
MANNSVPAAEPAAAPRLAVGEHYLTSMWRDNPLSDFLTNRLFQIDRNTKASVAILEVLRRDFTGSQDVRDIGSDEEPVLQDKLTEHTIDGLMLAMESLLGDAENLLDYVRENQNNVCRHPLKGVACG